MKMHHPSNRTGALLAAALLLGGCVVNPVTGRREVRLISEAREVSIGEQEYLPTQQSDGGEYLVDPRIGELVNDVGRRLAKASDRPDLPYEFVVQNSSTPNAWALPGGKIGITRGLLAALDDEAELAAVLGHEVVHAAAGHTVQAIQRGLVLQVAQVGVGIALGGKQYGGLAVGATALAGGLVLTGYGRDQERDADLYGMKYMERSGYDPQAAVSVQEKLLRLREDEPPGFLLGLFSTHPPSRERIEANAGTAATLPPGGRRGEESYAQAVAGIRRSKKAYESFDEGRKALAEGDDRRALALADAAIGIEPREALFYGLRAGARQQAGRYRAALLDYAEAIERNDRYFDFYLQRAIAREEDRDFGGAKLDFEAANRLLPTDRAHYSLGRMALAEGDEDSALEHFRFAARSGSAIGREARAAFARLDVARNPSGYVSVTASLGRGKQVFVTIRNDSPVAIEDIRVGVDLPKANTTKSFFEDLLTDDASVWYSHRLHPGQSAQMSTRIYLKKDQDLHRLGLHVTQARVAN